MPAAGPVILFVCLLALTAGLAVYVFAFAALCYLVVLQDTSAGLDAVVWPEEPVVDWLMRAAYLVVLTLVWLAPAGLLSRVLARTWLPNEPALRFFLLAVAGLWLLFPLGVLSSLSAGSRWVLLRPALAVPLLRMLPTLAGFYLSTGLLLACAAALWYAALFTPGGALLLAAAAPAGAAVLLIHARLVGRLGWLIQRQTSPEPRRAERAARTPRKKGKARRARKVQTHDPWAVPEEAAERAPELPVEGYGLAVDEPAPGGTETTPQKPQNNPPRPPEPSEEEGYAVGEAPEVPQAGTPEELPGGAAASELERRLRERKEDEYVPPAPLFSGVYTFPWYDSSLKAWLWLTLGGAALGGCVRGLVALWPR
jgi:hypothetical protein